MTTAGLRSQPGPGQHYRVSERTRIVISEVQAYEIRGRMGGFSLRLRSSGCRRLHGITKSKNRFGGVSTHSCHTWIGTSTWSSGRLRAHHPLSKPLSYQQNTRPVLSACCNEGSTVVNCGTPRHRLSAGLRVSPRTIERFPSSVSVAAVLLGGEPPGSAPVTR
jgi:hypothetical protein